jgi:sulfur carrier protein
MTDDALTLNGEVLAEHAETIAALLLQQGIDGAAARFVAVALNGQVVRRGDWATTRLGPGDAVEIVKPFQGG